MSNSLSLLIDFTEVRPVSACINCKYIKIYYLSDLIMPKPVWLMAIQEAHKEYNTLIDQIQPKYKLLDSGECGKVNTPALNGECSKLSHLLAHMSKLCDHLNLPMNFTCPLSVLNPQDRRLKGAFSLGGVRDMYAIYCVCMHLCKSCNHHCIDCIDIAYICSKVFEPLKYDFL